MKSLFASSLTSLAGRAWVGAELKKGRGATAVSDVSPHPSEAPRYAWYVWPQSFAAGSNKLRVRYHLKVLSAEAGADSRLTIS